MSVIPPDNITGTKATLSIIPASSAGKPFSIPSLSTEEIIALSLPLSGVFQHVS